MNLEEHEYFKKLTIDREENAKIIKKPSMSGVKKSVVDKYSDQAHFIYELLQNADDALATQTEFVLKDDGLLFKHNGKILFSVTDPNTEENDKDLNRLGHINSITSIGNNNKNEASIGKFGVGFKSVFQYTETPHIFDPNLKFKIERFIVPQLLIEDIAGRQADETVFYFPFDKKDINPKNAYSEIDNKLKSLTHPVLFLTSITKITWKTRTNNGSYSKDDLEKNKIASSDIKCHLISLTENNGNSKKEKKLWLFSKRIESEHHNYSVGFFLDKNNKLEPVEYNAFCFFPTKEATKLKFIIHAPFLLTDSRESIKAGDSWNRQLITKLSILAAESLLILKQIGIERGNRLIDDSIISIVPFRENDFSSINDGNKISFLPFYNEIKNKLQKEKLLPTKIGDYSSKYLSYWASDKKLTSLFSDTQISELVQKQNAQWVFTSIGRDMTLNEKELVDGVNKPLKADYISNLVYDFLDHDKLLKKITKSFIEKQSKEWLNNFYEYFIDKLSYLKNFKKSPIFINESNIAVAAFDENNRAILFLPSDKKSDYNTINTMFLNYPKSMDFFKRFGIETPNLRDEIYNKILPQFKNNYNIKDVEKLKSHFTKFFEYFRNCPGHQLNEYLKQFSDLKIIVCKSKQNNNITFLEKPDNCYYPSDILKQYFETISDVIFVDIDFYKSFFDTSSLEKVKDFFIKIGVSELPRIDKFLLNDTQKKQKHPYLTQQYTRYSYAYDKCIEGCVDIMEIIVSKMNFNKSVLLWSVLLKLTKKITYPSFMSQLQGEHEYFYGAGYIEKFDSVEIKRLTTSKWLVNKNGIFFRPDEISLNDLADEYGATTQDVKALADFLKLRIPKNELNLSEENLRIFNLGKEFNSRGLSISDIPAFFQWQQHKKLQQNANNVNSSESRSTVKLGTSTENTKSSQSMTDEEAEIIRQHRERKNKVLKEMSFEEFKEQWKMEDDEENITANNQDDIKSYNKLSSEAEYSIFKSYGEHSTERIAQISLLKRTVLSTKYSINDSIDPKEFLLNEYNGCCQICNTKLKTVKPYCEVFRIIETRGENKYSGFEYNVISLCPNCHVELKQNSKPNSFKNSIIKAGYLWIEKDISPEFVEERKGDYYMIKFKLNNEDKLMFYTQNHFVKLAQFVNSLNDCE